MAGSDIDTVARVLNLTPRRIYQLAHEPGFPPKPGKGEYDLQKITLWYIRYLQKELERRGPAGTMEGAGIQAERHKLLAAQAEKIQTENAVRRLELLSAEDVRNTWSRFVANVQKRLRGIPSSLGPQLTNKSDPAYIVDRLKNDIDQALTELAADGTSESHPVDRPEATSAAA